MELFPSTGFVQKCTSILRSGLLIQWESITLHGVLLAFGLYRERPIRNWPQRPRICRKFEDLYPDFFNEISSMKSGYHESIGKIWKKTRKNLHCRSQTKNVCKLEESGERNRRRANLITNKLRVPYQRGQQKFNASNPCLSFPNIFQQEV